MKLLPYLSNYDVIIWDWNGTLIEDIQITWEAYAKALKSKNLSYHDLETYRRKFYFPVRAYYESHGHVFNSEQYQEVCEQFVQSYRNGLETVQLFKGTQELLETLKSQGKRLAILSAAEHELLNEAVRRYGIEHFFEHICGAENHQAEGKIACGNALLEKLQIPKDQKAILVGDTEHDYDVAKALHIDALLIADGHQAYERLQKLPCTVLETRYITDI